MNRMAFLLRVSAQSVLNWLRAVAKEHDEKPEPTGRIIVLELDERGTYSARGQGEGPQLPPAGLQ